MLFTVQPDWVLEQAGHCGSAVYRRAITGNDWRIAVVQQRYYPHFALFINQRIEALRHDALE